MAPALGTTCRVTAGRRPLRQWRSRQRECGATQRLASHAASRQGCSGHGGSGHGQSVTAAAQGQSHGNRTGFQKCFGTSPHVTAAGEGKVTARRAQNQQRMQGQQPAGAARQSQSQIFSPSRQQSHKRTQNKPKPQSTWQKRGTMTFDVNRSKGFWNTPI